MLYFANVLFLAHQSTKCSRTAIVIVLCPSYVCCLKNHLLWNYKAKFNETSQVASFGVPLQKCNKGSGLINNNNNNNKMADFLFCFKNISWNYQSKLNEALQEASLGDPLQNYNKGSRLINNNNDNEMANILFWFKKTFPLKLPVQIQWNFTGSFLG